ncbi:MAG: hypothetical protein Q8N05_06360 [Bacteroidota bacterium]|nr:hypothetical protein [Bacteroidota bacterium]
MGWLGLMPDELYSLTLRQFFYKIEGFNEVRNADNELNYQSRFESARFTAAMVLSSLAGKKFDASFPWDRKKPIKLMTPERFAEIKKLWKIEEKSQSS